MENTEKPEDLEKRTNDDGEAQSGSETTLASEWQNGGKKMSAIHEAAFIITICMTQIFSLAGLGQGFAPLYIIGNSFGVTDPGKLSWYLAAFSLTVGTFILPAGRLGDIYGHKKIFLVGSLWYGLWSLIAGFSVYSGSILFSICRGFQGIGPALVVPNALAIAGRSFEGMKKNSVFSAFGACAPVGAVLGGIFAANLSQLVWWPWTYWVQGIILFVFTATSFLVMPSDDLEHGDSKPYFDFAGTITGVTGLVLFNFSWNQAGVVGWQDPYTYILMIVGILSFAAFIYVEWNIAECPLVPIKSLTREAGFALSIIACGWGSFGIWVYYLSQLLENLRKHSPLSAAAQLVTVAPSGIIASLATGFLLSKMKVAWIMVAAMCWFLTGQILIATTPVTQIYWAQTFVSLIIMPWGMDMSFPAGTIILSNGMPREHQGIAASLINTVVNYSISMGLGFAGTIILQTNDGGRDVLGGYRNAWYFGIGLDGIGLLIALGFLFISAVQKKDVK